jgi:glycosyltransferase involved in cell wall biosynthesis
MNFLFYTNFSPYGKNRVGGAEISLKTIAEMMSKNGYPSIFVTRGKRKLFRLVNKQTINNVHVYTIHKFRFPIFRSSIFKKINKYLNDKWFDYQMHQLLRKHKISIVHAHYNLQTCTYFLRLREQKKYNYKFVMRFAGMLWYESLKENPKLIEQYRYIFEQSDAINFVSEGLYRLYKKACSEHSYNFNIKKNFILDIGTTVNRLPKKSFDPEDNKAFKIVMASRFTGYQKRQDLLVQALSELKGKLPINLYLIGSGHNKDTIQSLIDLYDLNASIKIIPFLPQNELWGFMLKSDVLVHACDYEGSSKIIIESMGMGLPIIASNVLPLNDYITDGVTGYLAENNASEWAKKINQVYNERNKLPEISKNAREFVVQNYSAEKNIQKYIEYFSKLL